MKRLNVWLEGERVFFSVKRGKEGDSAVIHDKLRGTLGI